jgi:hypothetical protein
MPLQYFYTIFDMFSEELSEKGVTNLIRTALKHHPKEVVKELYESYNMPFTIPDLE